MVTLGVRVGAEVKLLNSNLKLSRMNYRIFSSVLNDNLKAVPLSDFALVADLYKHIVASYDGAMKEASLGCRSTSRR